MSWKRGVFGCAVLGAAVFALAATAAAQGFNAVYSKDGLDVWAVGRGGAVYRSLDGGAIWGSYPLGGANHRAVAAQGVDVWIVGDGGAYAHSTNSGFSFSSGTLAGGVSLRCVVFSDATTGWIAGYAGTILKTVDGGANWSPMTTNTSENLYAIRFSGSEGWAVGANGTLLHSVDGGANWTPSQPFSVNRTLYDIDLSGTKISVSGNEAFVAISTNSGGSWTEPNMWMESRSDVNGVEILPNGNLWYCGGGGFLRTSADNGATWSFGKHTIVTGMGDVYFVDNSKGFACAQNTNNVLRTTDGGTTWSVPGGGAFTYTWALKQSTGASIRGNTFDIDPLNRDKIYCVLGLTVYASTNKGETWSSVATITGGGNETNSFYVSRTDPNIWVAAVQSTDRVTRTTNAGATWTTTKAEAMSEYGMPLERDPNDPNILYYGTEGGGGASDGNFWKSTDFGATWSLIATPGFRSPCDIVAVVNGNGLLYCGDGVTGAGNGVMWRSTNGGANWSQIYSTSGSEIPAIAASQISTNNGFSTHWSSGGVRRTTNAGVNWTQVATTGSAWGTEFARDDGNVVLYGVYSGGTSYFTTDVTAGTISWGTASLSGSNYGLMAYERGTLLAQQSGGVYKATFVQPGMPTNNAQSIALVSPNGGEAWAYNTVHNVTWTSQNVAAVKIEYSADEGPWQLITASTPGTAGSYAWVVPAVASTNVTIRVSDTNDAAPIDNSNAAFSIIVPSISTVQSSLALGDVEVGASSSQVLNIQNTGTATLVISNVTVMIGDPIANPGGVHSKSANPAFESNRTSFSIPVASADTLEVIFSPDNIQAYYDTLLIHSNAPNSPTKIPLSGNGLDPIVLRVTAPDGGEEWQYNTSHDVNWTAGHATTVNVEYETSPGGGWNAIAMGIPASPSTTPWTLPATATTEARVRVSDAANALVLDLSNAPFSITVQALDVTPLSVAYGSVVQSTTKIDTVRIANPGTAPLHVLSVVSDAGEFVPSRTNFIVAPASSDTIAVAFTPALQQPYAATLTVTTDAPSPSMQVALSGTGVAPTSVSGTAPARFELRESAPNPFGATGTAITYGLPKATDVSLIVYNAAGQEVATLAKGRQNPGFYTVDFRPTSSGSSLAGSVTSGVYFYRLTAGEYVETKRMVLVR